MTVIEVNDLTFQAEVVDSKIPVIVDFFAPWCGPCQMMGPVFEKISKEFEGKLKFVKLDTQKYPNIAQRYDISGIPCLIITEQGEEMDRIVGYREEDELKKEIERLI